MIFFDALSTDFTVLEVMPGFSFFDFSGVLAHPVKMTAEMMMVMTDATFFFMIIEVISKVFN
jgi:hypothetical protein